MKRQSQSLSRRVGIDQLLSAYHYELPEERIAQNPVVPRDSSRLLVVDSPTHHRHCIFQQLPDFLKPGDLLVLNNTRVIPARLYGRKSSGALVEVLLLEERQNNCWLALVKPGKRFKIGTKIEFERIVKHLKKQEGRGKIEAERGKIEAENDLKEKLEMGAEPPFAIVPFSNPDLLTATVLDTDAATGGRLLKFEVPDGGSVIPLLDQFGCIPLPPYVTNFQASPEQYQTIYAAQPGAVAAPTAGLHFTPELLERLTQQGIEQAFVTLHVGIGTFRPVEVDDITHHPMHGEWIEVPEETVDKIRDTQARGGRIIAVGTTAVRALEGAALATSKSGKNSPESQIAPYCGHTHLFIYPGYQWQVVEGLITNFHLPRSSLLMLVSAMIGRQRLLDLYQEAITHQYRFYSFGDAMLILPEGRI